MRQLDASLEEFDGVLLEESRAIEAKPGRSAQGEPAGSTNAARAGSGTGWGDTEETAAAGSRAGNPSGTDSGAAEPTGAQTGQIASRPRGPGGDGGGMAPVPDDVGDGSDDDVVARNLREAAMQESDPELREKLWEEYRNYKRGG